MNNVITSTFWNLYGWWWWRFNALFYLSIYECEYVTLCVSGCVRFLIRRCDILYVNGIIYNSGRFDGSNARCEWISSLSNHHENKFQMVETNNSEKKNSCWEQLRWKRFQASRNFFGLSKLNNCEMGGRGKRKCEKCKSSGEGKVKH